MNKFNLSFTKLRKAAAEKLSYNISAEKLYYLGKSDRLP